MEWRALSPGGIRHLFDLIRGDSYRVVGPARSGDSITLAEVAEYDALALGLELEVAPGRARVVPSSATFGVIGAPDSLKRWQHAPQRVIWEGERGSQGYTGSAVVEESAGPVAFFGVRACDLAGARVLSRSIRRNLGERDLTIALQCTSFAPTCFCTTMGTGPAVPDGAADIVLTEVPGDPGSFLVGSGSAAGQAVLDRLDTTPAAAASVALTTGAVERVAAAMPRMFDPPEARAALSRPGPGWDEVGRRCLACGNCTAVCPTCFCVTVVDRTDPAATRAQRVMRWDSCFTPEFSEMHGGPLRTTTASRYRQWVSHKISWWWEQWGTAGCVGCGRCIVWCPVGIDIRQEVTSAIQRSNTRV